MPRGARGAGVRRLTVATLSRELADFLVELSITLNKHTIYPAGHPLLGVAIDGVANRLELLFTGERDSLSLGVARKQLVIEGVATDPQNPVLKELAQRLHKHHVGALRFERGITRDELADALAALSVDPIRSERPIGLDRKASADRWQHVHFFPLTYDRLQMIEDDPEGEPPRGDQLAASRSTQLWIGLARAALVADVSDPDVPREEPDDEMEFEPATVARAIDEHQREQAYDQVIVGYLLQIGEELKTAEGPEATGLQRRVSRLVGSLKESTLERLLEMGGDKAQRRKFLLDASQGVTVEAVVDLVKAASRAEGQTVSHSMLRMLGKLAHHPSSRGRYARSNPMVRDVMKRMVDDWSLDDPNPAAYKAALESLAKPGTGAEDTTRASLATVCEPERLVKIGIEVGAFGPQVREAMSALRHARRYETLLDLVEGAPSAEAGAPIAEYLKEQRILAEILKQERVDFGLAGRFARRTGASAAAALLDAVLVIEDAKARVPYYELLESLGEDIGPEVASRLPEASAYLQRELLAALGRLRVLPDGFSARPYMRHSEAVVRREAARILLRDPAARNTTILSAIGDSDNRVVFTGLVAAQEGCQPTCLDLIRRRVEKGDLDAQLRTMGIRIVARQRTIGALDWLLGFVVAGARWPRRPRLKPATPEMLAALGEIASNWQEDKRAAAALALGRNSKDPEVRAKADRGRPRESRAAAQ